MHDRRAFSLIEVVVVLVLVAILSAVAATALRNFQRESRDRTARTALETVAGAQETYHLNRGRWGLSNDALTAFSGGEFAVTTGASSGPAVVSVAAVDVDGHDALGLAVLDGNQDCLTLVLVPPTAGQTYEIQRRPGTMCTGAQAGLP